MSAAPMFNKTEDMITEGYYWDRIHVTVSGGLTVLHNIISPDRADHKAISRLIDLSPASTRKDDQTLNLFTACMKNTRPELTPLLWEICYQIHSDNEFSGITMNEIMFNMLMKTSMNVPLFLLIKWIASLSQNSQNSMIWFPCDDTEHDIQMMTFNKNDRQGVVNSNEYPYDSLHWKTIINFNEADVCVEEDEISMPVIPQTLAIKMTGKTLGNLIDIPSMNDKIIDHIALDRDQRTYVYLQKDCMRMHDKPIADLCKPYVTT